MKSQPYDKQIKQRYKYHNDRLDTLLTNTYQKPREAKNKAKRLIQEKGLKIALLTIEKDPARLGKLAGNRRFGFNNAKRFQAVLMIDTLLQEMEVCHRVGLEYQAAQKRRSNATEKENQSGLFRSLLSKLSVLRSAKGADYER